MSDMPKCACLTVHYDPIHNSDGTNTSRWRCVDCKTEFSRVLSRVEVYGPGFNESIPYADTAPACRACGGIGSDDEGTGARCDVCDGSGLARSSAVDVDGEQGGGIGNDPDPDRTSAPAVEGAHFPSSRSGFQHPRSPSTDATGERRMGRCTNCDAPWPCRKGAALCCLYCQHQEWEAVTDVSEDQREGGQHGVTRTAGQPAHPGAATGSATGSTPTGDVGGSSGGGSREVLHVPDGPSREPQGGVGMDPTLDRASHRQRCAVCHQVDPVMFWVPGPVWGQVVPVEFQQSIVCLRCFVSYADEIMVAWDEEIAFAPVSLATHLRAVTPMDRGMHVRPAPTEAGHVLLSYDEAHFALKEGEVRHYLGWLYGQGFVVADGRSAVVTGHAEARLHPPDERTGVPAANVGSAGKADPSGSASASVYPERDGPGTLQDEVRRRLAVIKHNDAEENLTGWNEEGMRVIIRGFISDTESLLRLLDHRAAGSATGEPHVCAATGGECKFFGGEL